MQWSGTRFAVEKHSGAVSNIFSGRILDRYCLNLEETRGIKKEEKTGIRLYRLTVVGHCDWNIPLSAADVACG